MSLCMAQTLFEGLVHVRSDIFLGQVFLNDDIPNLAVAYFVDGGVAQFLGRPSM